MVAGFAKGALLGVSRSRFVFRIERFGGSFALFRRDRKYFVLASRAFRDTLAALSKLALQAGCLSRNELRDDFAGG